MYGYKPVSSISEIGLSPFETEATSPNFFHSTILQLLFKFLYFARKDIFANYCITHCCAINKVSRLF